MFCSDNNLMVARMKGDAQNSVFTTSIPFNIVVFLISYCNPQTNKQLLQNRLFNKTNIITAFEIYPLLQSHHHLIYHNHLHYTLLKHH